ncbi:Cell death protease [Gryganskiella cystojenkinii]|nr:Cell death protease [Gryganskiella cystojenkinii]
MSILRLTVAIVAAVLVTPLSMVDAKGHVNPADQYRIDTRKLPHIDHALTTLPQWSGQLPVSANNTLFFWYTQAADVKSDNLIFWHNGGPGCSSLEGLFEENGPYNTKDNGRSWQMSPHSWHNLGHVVYIDQPFGTGFSSNQTTVPDEDFIGDTMVNFYKNFFKTFPEMKSKKMYITGESYAGRYIPYMAKHVLSHNKAQKHAADKINLKAVAIGDAYVDTVVRNDFIDYLPYLKEHPWMAGNNKTWFAEAEKIVATATKLHGCGDVKSQHDISEECAGLMNTFYNDMSNPVDFPISNCTGKYGPVYLDPYNIAVTDCNTALKDLAYAELPWEYYLNLPGVQDTIHVGANINYSDCGGNNKGIYRSDGSVVPKYFIGDLINQGLKVTLYTGLLDSVVPHTLTEAALRVMKWKGHQGFQHSKMTAATMTPIKIKGHKNIGTYHSERGMSYVVFNNAGHMVPRDEPVGALWMMEKIVMIN